MPLATRDAWWEGRVATGVWPVAGVVEVARRGEGAAFEVAMVFHPGVVVDFAEVARAVVGEENHHHVVVLEVLPGVFERAVDGRAAGPAHEQPAPPGPSPEPEHHPRRPAIG